MFFTDNDIAIPPASSGAVAITQSPIAYLAPATKQTQILKKDDMGVFSKFYNLFFSKSFELLYSSKHKRKMPSK